jgi:hypothetical protein
MNSIVNKLNSAYPKDWILPTSKTEALRTLDLIKATIEAMDDFDHFPEGDTGVILYALLKNGSCTCPDAGDFNYYHQGCEQILKTAFQVIAEEIRWF